MSKVWTEHWPAAKRAQHWDAIGRVNGKWILVEAKAHEGEMRSDCKAGERSRAIINNRLEELKKEIHIKSERSWILHYYQKANRLLFAKFLEDNGFDCSILFVYFNNGYKDKSVKTKSEWVKLINVQDEYLGIVGNEWVKSKVKNVFIDCKR